MYKPILSDISASVHFLSRLPLPSNIVSPSPSFSKIAWSFPLAGIIIALPSALLLYGSLKLGLSPLVSSLIAVMCMVALTGALHEDGLADVADGFYGGHTVQQKLQIMRDSHIGTYGTLALIFSIALKSALLAEIASELGNWKPAIVFICAASLSRTAMLYLWSRLPSARSVNDQEKDGSGKETSGLSARFGSPSIKTYYVAALVSLPVLGALFWTVGFGSLVIGIAMLKLSTLAMTQLSKQKIGGHTGDTLGATQQISEIGLLLGLTIAM